MTWIYAFLLAFFISAALGPVLIPILRKLKFGQTILKDGPVWHSKKQGTPIMGGLMFIFGISVASVIFAPSADSLSVLACAVLFGAIGFVDDYIKVVKKRNKGLGARQKFGIQALVSVAFAIYIAQFLPGKGVLVPFSERYLDLGIFYIPFIVAVLLSTANSVNLTDGIDGLAASICAIAALFFTVASNRAGMTGAGVVAAACAGGVLAFLLYNFHPARVFMGDTGSLFLGGLLGAVAVVSGMELFLILSGFVFLAEALSDIIQVFHYKRTKKRVFKMAPIHHHFEKSGWSETKIVAVFALVSAVLCVISYIGIKI